MTLVNVSGFSPHVCVLVSRKQRNGYRRLLSVHEGLTLAPVGQLTTLLSETELLSKGLGHVWVMGLELLHLWDLV